MKANKLSFQEIVYSAFSGIFLALIVLQLVSTSKRDELLIKGAQMEAQRLQDFRSWADELCANGWAEIEMTADGEYKAICH